MHRKKLLIVGIGGMVGTNVVRDLIGEGYTNIAGVDTDPDVMQKLPSLFSIPLYGTIKEAFENEQIGGVYICSPDFAHRDNAVEALSYDVPVLSEKPMGLNRDDALQMLKASKKTKGWLQIGFEYRFSLLFARTKEIINSGELGRAVNVFSEYCSGPYPKEALWRLDTGKNSGVFTEKLCHMIDLFRFWLNDEVMEVQAFRGINVTPWYPHEIPDNVTGIYRFQKSGIAVLVHNHVVAADPEGLEGKCSQMQSDPHAKLLNFRAAGHQQRSCIICERGTLIVDAWAKHIIVNERKENGNLGVKRIEDFHGKSFIELSHDIKGEVLDFIGRFEKGLPPRLDTTDSYLTTLVTIASEESLRKSIPIKLDFDLVGDKDADSH